MANGIIIIDKPADWTSMDVCAKLRGILKTKKVGHAGTLDPMATGVLPVFVGQATRGVSFAESGDKEYLAVLRLGLVTNTQDTSGQVLHRTEELPDRAALEAVLPRFTGEISQLPPMYSAIKIGGKKLYELARQGKEVERRPRPVTIHALELVEQTRPDIVLLDLILPGMDGLDFLRALRRRSARPAVVVASQASEPTVIRLAFQLGASYYLIKPLNFDSLPDLFHSLCLEPRERAAADYLRGMGASGLGVEAAARTAAVLSTGAEGAIPLKEGYAAAMAAQNTSYACVEKNIRSMVGKLQAGACGEYQALMGGLPAERPSNELFLRRLARRILEW